jgi:hypothetical protein
MSAPALLYTASFDTLIYEYGITLGNLRARPETASLRPSYESFADSLLASSTQDSKLLLEVIATGSVVRVRDGALDEVTDLVLEAILVETKGSYSAPLYKHFAGEERPSVFKRPILGKQLDKVRTWPASMAQSSELLQDLKEIVSIVVKDADVALISRDNAQEERTRFRAVGDRRKLIEQFTELRNTLYEDLIGLATDQKIGDPIGYARSFFVVRESQNKVEAEAKLSQLQTQREEQQQALAQINAEITELTAEVEAKRLDDETREAARIELAVAASALAEAKRKVAALRARKKK